ncbi:hypothetical protein [Streptomyces cyaneofuscatus]|uniref:hypothetical protein n=1 Tax=Streptomyces cyaneofuscatus TaxID=66883 RepID=UPI00382075FC
MSVVRGCQAVLQLGFAMGKLLHHVFVLGLTLLVLGPFGVAEVRGVIQEIPWWC